MAKAQKHSAGHQMHAMAQEAAAQSRPWLRWLLRGLGLAGVLLGGSSLLASVLPLPDAVDQVIDWYRSTAHPAIASAIGSVLGGGFFAKWAADAGVTAIGGALLGLARKRN